MILQYQVKYLDRAAPMVAQSILFHILIEKREKLALDQELAHTHISRLYEDVTWVYTCYEIYPKSQYYWRGCLRASNQLIPLRVPRGVDSNTIDSIKFCATVNSNQETTYFSIAVLTKAHRTTRSYYIVSLFPQGNKEN